MKKQCEAKVKATKDVCLDGLVEEVSRLTNEEGMSENAACKQFTHDFNAQNKDKGVSVTLPKVRSAYQRAAGLRTDKPKPARSRKAPEHTVKGCAVAQDTSDYTKSLEDKVEELERQLALKDEECLKVLREELDELQESLRSAMVQMPMLEAKYQDLGNEYHKQLKAIKEHFFGNRARSMKEFFTTVGVSFDQYKKFRKEVSNRKIKLYS